MKHAFLILAHNYPNQLSEIINLLLSSDHYIFIHIDKKFKELMLSSFDLKNIIEKESNVTLIDNLINVNWGGYSQIQATINLLTAVKKHRINFDFIHLISGQDYPLKRNEFFDEFFEKFRNYSFIGMVNNPQIYVDRLKLYYFNDIVLPQNIKGRIIKYLLDNIVNIEKKVNKYFRLRSRLDYEIYKGSNWWSLNKEMFEYIMDFLEHNPKYIKRFKFTNCCDEIFFHVIAFNSPIKKNIIKNNLRFVDWNPRFINEHVPRVLDESYWSELKNSDYMFCRKIIPDKSTKLISLIKNSIKG